MSARIHIRIAVYVKDDAHCNNEYTKHYDLFPWAFGLFVHKVFVCFEVW